MFAALNLPILYLKQTAYGSFTASGDIRDTRRRVQRYLDGERVAEEAEPAVAAG